MDIQAKLEQIHEYIESGHADKAVIACLRVSRKIKDYFHTAIFLMELSDVPDEIKTTFFYDTSALNDNAQKEIFSEAVKAWIATRKCNLDTGVGQNNDEKNILSLSVGAFSSELEQCELTIRDFKLPPNLGEFDVAAFTDKYTLFSLQLRNRIRQVNIIKSRILVRCLNFVIQVERQLDAQRKTRSFLEDAQNEVQNYFKIKSPDDVYEKLQKANQLIDSNDTQDFALLLTQIRRAIKSVSDHFYPSRAELVMCSDGKQRQLGEEQYLNRLEEYLVTQFGNSTSSELLKAELQYLSVFARKLNDIASKGVHTDVTFSEAKQGFLGLYMFLYNVCSRLEGK